MSTLVLDDGEKKTLLDIARNAIEARLTDGKLYMERHSGQLTGVGASKSQK